MNKAINLFLILSLVFGMISCDTSEDVLARLDHTVPSIRFSQDSLTVIAGNTAGVILTVEDESGIDRIEFSYGNWLINKIYNLKEENNPKSYNLTLEFQVPENALRQWEENLYFNDGTFVKIIQQYHKLSIKTWDMKRNMNTGIIYVKVQ